jgi:hypothetical protein
MSKGKSAVRRPQASKSARERAKVLALYVAGTGETVTTTDEDRQWYQVSERESE